MDVETGIEALYSSGRMIMGRFFVKIKQYLHLLGVFAKFSLMSQMEYRANFLAGIAVETGWMLIKLLYVAIVYRAGVNIGILTPDHIMLFIGIYVLMTDSICCIMEILLH